LKKKRNLGREGKKKKIQRVQDSSVYSNSAGAYTTLYPLPNKVFRKKKEEDTKVLFT